jgi:hypothetical protein
VAVTTGGGIRSLAGIGTNPSDAGFSGDGGSALNAEFNNPGSLVLDQAGNVYVVDRQNERIRMLTPVNN